MHLGVLLISLLACASSDNQSSLPLDTNSDVHTEADQHNDGDNTIPLDDEDCIAVLMSRNADKGCAEGLIRPCRVFGGTLCRTPVGDKR